MKFPMRFGLGVAVTLLIAIGTSAPASAQMSAPLTICNKTDAPVIVAAGYPTLGVDDGPNHNLLTGPFVTKGWGTIAPGACHVIENPFKARYMYWLGFSTKLTSDDAEIQVGTLVKPPAGGANLYCIPKFENGTGPFTFEDENVRPSDQGDPCEASGKNMWAQFQPVDTWVSATVNFTGLSSSSP